MEEIPENKGRGQRSQKEGDALEAQLEARLDVIDSVRLILEMQTRRQIHGLQNRLDSFAAVNWDALKQRLRHQMLLQPLPAEVLTLADLERYQVQMVLNCLETVLSE